MKGGVVWSTLSWPGILLHLTFLDLTTWIRNKKKDKTWADRLTCKHHKQCSVCEVRVGERGETLQARGCDSAWIDLVNWGLKKRRNQERSGKERRGNEDFVDDDPTERGCGYPDHRCTSWISARGKEGERKEEEMKVIRRGYICIWTATNCCCFSVQNGKPESTHHYFCVISAVPVESATAPSPPV